MSKVIAVVNQKGGVGKTTTCGNLGIGLARNGKKVLLIDADSQGDLTASLGYQEPDEMDITVATVMMNIINEVEMEDCFGILHNLEGVDLLPANIDLAAMEISLVNVMSRELVLKRYIDCIRDKYDYILIDGMPSLSMITINILAAADSVLIPVKASYLPSRGLKQLIKTVLQVKRNLNMGLEIEGIIINMYDKRTKNAKKNIRRLQETFGDLVYIFNSRIPNSVRAEESSETGQSIYEYDPNGIVRKAYSDFVREVLDNERKCNQ